MTDNIIITILEKEEQRRKEEAEQRKEWGISQRNRLVEVLEKEGAIITNHVWDLLLFNINSLRINSEGKIFYLSFYKESKKNYGIIKKI